MIACLSNHSTRPAKLPIQREFEEDQLRWEEQIRALSTPRTARPAQPVQPPRAPTRLALTSRVGQRDLLLLPRALPALIGTGTEDLLCGKCSGLIGSGLSCRAARREHSEGTRLVIRCTCGAMNMVSSGRGTVR